MSRENAPRSVSIDQQNGMQKNWRSARIVKLAKPNGSQSCASWLLSKLASSHFHRELIPSSLSILGESEWGSWETLIVCSLMHDQVECSQSRQQNYNPSFASTSCSKRLHCKLPSAWGNSLGYPQSSCLHLGKSGKGRWGHAFLWQHNPEEWTCFGRSPR